MYVLQSTRRPQASHTLYSTQWRSEGGGLAGHVPGQSIMFVPLSSRNLARSARERRANGLVYRALGNEVEVVFRLRVAELADGVVWLEMVCFWIGSGWNLPPAHHTVKRRIRNLLLRWCRCYGG